MNIINVNQKQGAREFNPKTRLYICLDVVKVHECVWFKRQNVLGPIAMELLIHCNAVAWV